MTDMIRVKALCKEFVLHTQGGTRLPVLSNLSLNVQREECVALVGASGAGKSTLMRAIYANYRASAGQVQVSHDNTWLDMSASSAQVILDIRRRTIGYVSQFLRVIPRVSTLDIVMEPGLEAGASPSEVQRRAQALLTRLNVPEKLWSLPPATFSGGEQQRINVARGFIYDYPILLLDEPTASLDPVNREVVVELIEEAKRRGSAIVGIFHDEDIRRRVTTREFSLTVTEAA